MIGEETFRDYSEYDHTQNAVAMLKHAAAYKSLHLNWESSDGNYYYAAAPLEELSEQDADLRNLPLWRFAEVLNEWSLYRLSLPDINGNITIDRFLIGAGLPMVVSSHHDITEQLLFDAPSEVLNEYMSSEAQIQGDLGLNEPSLFDYAIVDNALFDLAPIAKKASDEAFDAMRNMTEEERRWERLQKISWLSTPEVQKDTKPRWWGITEGSLLWAVHSPTPDEAILMIEDKRGGVPILPFFFVDEYPDDIQTELGEKLGDETVVRLIPWSIEPWPEDPENMSDAQKAAFENLKRD